MNAITTKGLAGGRTVAAGRANRYTALATTNPREPYLEEKT